MRFSFKINKARKLIKNISNNEFYYLSEEKYLMKYINGNEIVLINNFKCEIVEEWNKGFLINENTFYNFSFCELLFNDDNTYKSLIINNNELLIKELDFENEKIKFGFYNHINGSIEWKSTDNNIVPYFSISNNTFISFSKLGFQNFDFTFNLLWQFNFIDVIQSENAFLHSKIIEKDDKLFFVIDGSENRGLFCLDTKTGEILQKFSVCYYEIFEDKNYIYTTSFENKLCRINAKTLELDEWDVNDLIKKNGFDNIHDHRCVAQNGLFYFTQTLGDNKAKFGVLDFDKKELLYKYEFEPNNGGISGIQVSEDRIFIHTQDNILHIFEKE